MEYKLKLLISVTIESDLPEEEAIMELAQDTAYSIPSTENVTVTKTEIIEVN